MARITTIFFLFSSIFTLGCFNPEPIPGPDKGGRMMVQGALLGGGIGAVVGAQTGVSLGPAMWTGVGFGMVGGVLRGFGIDIIEDMQIVNLEKEFRAREKIWAQEILASHYARRLELHPSRDIYPADLFFRDDGVALTLRGKVLAREIGRLTKKRMPWSRIIVAAYATTSNLESEYARHLTSRRAKAIASAFIKTGVEARRVQTKPVAVREPVLIDPHDSPGRYRQAIEVIALDY